MGHVSVEFDEGLSGAVLGLCVHDLGAEEVVEQASVSGEDEKGFGDERPVLGRGDEVGRVAFEFPSHFC